MVEQRQKEFDILSEKAHEILMPNQPSTLFLSVQPAFFEHHSWIVQHIDNCHFTIEHIEWDKPFDAHRFRDPMAGLKHGWDTTPTIVTSTYGLQSNELQSMIDKIRDMELILPDRKRGNAIDGSDGITMDGEMWFIRVQNAFDDATLTWNGYPRKWQRLVMTAHQIRDILQGG